MCIRRSAPHNWHLSSPCVERGQGLTCRAVRVTVDVLSMNPTRAASTKTRSGAAHTPHDNRVSWHLTTARRLSHPHRGASQPASKTAHPLQSGAPAPLERRRPPPAAPTLPGGDSGGRRRGQGGGHCATSGGLHAIRSCLRDLAPAAARTAGARGTAPRQKEGALNAYCGSGVGERPLLQRCRPPDLGPFELAAVKLAAGPMTRKIVVDG